MRSIGKRTLTKRDIAEMVRRDELAGLTLSQSIHAVDGVMRALCEAFVAGDDVEIKHVCAFRQVAKSRKRIAAALGTGKEVIVPERRDVRLRLSKRVLEMMNYS